MGAKHDKARALIASLIENGNLVLSTQIVREYSNVFLKKLGNKEAGSLIGYADNILIPHVRVIETPEMIRAAVLLAVDHNIGFYDALILQAAIELGCGTLYSEDFQNGREYSGVKIVNPFL